MSSPTGVRRRKSARINKTGSNAQLGDPSPVRKKKVHPLPATPQHPRMTPVQFEFRRKLLHSSIGFLALYGYSRDFNEARVVNVLVIPLTIITTADILRFRWKAFARLYERVLGFLMRPAERTTWNGTIWYLLGVIIVLTCLPRDIAVLSVCILSWADTAASTAGRTLGRYTPALPFPGFFAARKSVAGTTAAIVTGALAAYVFFSRIAPDTAVGAPSWMPLRRISFKHPGPSPLRLPTPASTLSLPNLCIVVGLIAGFAEAVEIWGLDDNLSLPVLSGLLIWLVLFASSKHTAGPLQAFFSSASNTI